MDYFFGLALVETGLIVIGCRLISKLRAEIRHLKRELIAMKYEI